MWKISSINNSTHEVTLSDDLGNELKTVVPLEHQISRDVKLAYITSLLESKNLEQKLVKRLSSISPKVLLTIILAEAVIIAILTLLRIK